MNYSKQEAPAMASGQWQHGRSQAASLPLELRPSSGGYTSKCARSDYRRSFLPVLCTEPHKSEPSRGVLGFSPGFCYFIPPFPEFPALILPSGQAEDLHVVPPECLSQVRSVWIKSTCEVTITSSLGALPTFTHQPFCSLS